MMRSRTAQVFALKPLVVALASALPLLAHGQAGVRPPPPPANALPVPAPAGWRVLGTGGAWAPTVAATGSTATIRQDSQRATYNWQSFDLGSGSTLTYQFRQADGSALNRVTGAAASIAPSQIFGRLNSTVPGPNGSNVTGGTVLLINQNGILFGPTAQVNTGALIASTLNVSDADYLSGFDSTLRSTAPTFVYEGGPELYVNSSNSNFVRVDAGAVIETASGGRVFLFAQQVDNAGTIRTPAGQTVLAGGGSVFLNDPSSQRIYASEANASIPALRGLLVEVGGRDGSVRNSGVIEVPRGNATLVGMAVNQSGRISATTSVTENGSVFLLARGGAVGRQDNASVVKEATVGGRLTLGAGSTIEIAPDTTRDAAGQLPTIDATTAFTASRVELSGRSIEMQQGARIVAPGGVVNARAEAVPQYSIDAIAAGNAGPFDSSARLTLGANASIDVSGTTSTDVSAARNFVTTELLGANDLRDAPLQRDGPLRRGRVTFDVREAVPILGDTSSYVNAIRRTAEERLALGGTVTLAATGAVIADGSSRVDVSGGIVNYSAAQVRPSVLIAEDGSRFSLNVASPDVRYRAVEGGAASVFDRWGRVVQYEPGRSRAEPGYVEGRDAGTFRIAAPVALLGGHIAAVATQGERQIAGRDTRARDGAIDIGTRVAGSNPFGGANEAAGVLRDFAVTAAPRALPAGLFDRLAPGALPAQSWITASALNLSGAGTIRATTYGGIEIEDGANLALPRLGSLELTAAGSAGISLGGAIVARGGSVLAQTIDVPLAAGGSELPGGRTASGDIVVRTGTRLDVAGDWVNQSLDGVAAGRAVAGGSMQLLSAHGLDVRDGSVIDVSGGATVSTAGAVTGSNAGSITLASQRGSLVATGDVPPSAVHIGAELHGESLAGGGTLRIRAAEIDIVDERRFGPRQTIRDGAGVGMLAIDDAFFSQGGFTNFDLEGAQRLGVGAGTTIAPQALRWVAQPEARFAATGSRPAEQLVATTLPQGQRNPASVRLAANGLVRGGPSGNLVVGAAARIEADAGASVTLSAGRSLVIDDNARISAPGGRVMLELSRNPALNTDFSGASAFEVRSGAVVDVSGTTVLQPTPPGLRQGRVLDGGTISLAVLGTDLNAPRNAVIDVAAGATLRADGASDRLDVAVRSNAGTTIQRSDVASAGGRIDIDANDGGARIAGQLSARSGGGTASDGALALRFAVPASTTPNPLVGERRIEVSAAPIGATPRPLGVAAISSVTIAAGGFADVTLRSPDVIRMIGDVALEAGRSITLQTPVLTADPGAEVRIAAPGDVRLGSPFASAAPVSPQPPIAPGGARVQVEAGVVTWSGTQQLRSIDDLDVTAATAIRFDAAALGVAQAPGRLAGTTDFTFRAPQSTVATAADFTIDAPGHRVTFIGGGAAAAPMLSAGGSLTVNAARIEQAGVVRAPFGSIAFNASDSVALRPGSVTSVSGTNLVVPYGSLLGGEAWSFNGGAVTAPPVKNIALTTPAGRVDVAAGASLGLAGGGSVLAQEFVPGPGGSRNVFTGALDGSFAIVPGIRDLPPLDADIARSTAEAGATLPAPGQQITIGPGSTLAAGTYAVLPARYAVLPGAFLVTPGSRAAVDASYSVVRPDGAVAVAGRRGSSGTAYSDALASVYVVRTTEQARQLSEIRTASADAYFTERAEFAGMTVPRLIQDAGSLQLAANRIGLAGSIDFARSTTPLDGRPARGGEVDIAAGRIVVADPGAAAAAAAAADTLVLTAAQINATGASSVVLGGSRSAAVGAGARSLDVSAREVVVANTGEAITVADLIVAADERVAIAPRARIAPGADSAPRDALAATGDGALVRASADADARVTRTGVQRSGGEVEIGAAAAITSGGLIIESTARTQIAADATLAARSITVGAPRIAVGDAAAAGAPAPAANTLIIGPALTSQISAADSLTLRSFSGIDFYGSASLGGATQRELTLDSASLAALGAGGQVRVEAGQVQLTNSSGATATASGGSGTFNVQANGSTGSTGMLRLGGSVALQGFGDARLTAASGVSFADGADLRGGGQMVVAAPSLTAAQAATAALGTAGLLRIEAAGTAVPSGERGVGAALTLTGSRIEQAGTIALPSGRLDLVANGGGIDFAAGSTTDLAGSSRVFDSIAVATSGGSLSAQARGGGNVVVAAAVGAQAGATIDVSAGGPGARAGSVALSAVSGAISIGGSLNARSIDGSGGTLVLDSRDAVDLAALATTLTLPPGATSSNFASGLSIRNRQGDQTLAAGSTLASRHIEIAADVGRVVLAGTLDAGAGAGGAIDIAAGGDVSLTSGAALRAAASNADGDGGRVRLQTSAGRLSLAAGAAIDVAGGADGSAGRVQLRGARSAAGVEVQVDAIGATIAGADRVDVEAVKVYELGQNVVVNSTVTSRVGADNVAFAGAGGAQAAAILDRLAGGDAALRDLLHLRSGVEIRSTGDMTVTGDTANAGWNLTPFAANAAPNRPGGEPMNLTLRAAGTLRVEASISDGFRAATNGVAPTTATAASRIVAESTIAGGHGSDLRLVGGADLGAASATATSASTTTGDVVIGRANTDVIVRTTDGTLEVAAGRDVSLVNRQAVAYVTGLPVATAGLAGWAPPAVPANAYALRSGSSVQSPFLDGGGEVSIRAERDVRGATAGRTQYASNWWWRGDSLGSTDVISWWSRYDRFRQGFGSFGGGDIQITAGRDARDVQFAAGSSGYIVPAVGDGAARLVRIGAGSASLDAGRDVAGGFVFADGPRIDVHAGNRLTTGSATSSGPTSLQVLHGDTRIDIEAARDTTIGRVGAAGLVPAVTNQFNGSNQAYNFLLTGLGRDASLRAVAAAGSMDFLTSPPAASDTEGISTTVANRVIPERAVIAAPQGSARIARSPTATGISQLPDDRAELSLLARDDLDVGSVVVNGVRRVANPGRATSQEVSEAQRVVFGAGLLPQQDANAEPVRLVSSTGDVTLGGQVQVAAPLRIVAAGDIVVGGGSVQAQHENPARVSLLDAGRDVQFAAIESAGFFLHGPGDLVVRAGRNVDLSTSKGFSAQGNRDNGALPVGSAVLTVVAGSAAGDWSAAQAAYFHLLGGTGVAGRPGELVAQFDASAQGQALPPLGSAAATAFSALPIAQQLDGARRRAGNAAYDAALLALMRRQAGDPTLTLVDARTRFDAATDAVKAGLVGSALVVAWAAQVPATGRVELALALAGQAPADGAGAYGAALRDYVGRRTGITPATVADAAQRFAELAPEAQLIFTNQVLAAEVRAAGRAAAALSGAARDAAYGRAYAAIDTVFPALAAGGDIEMGASQIKTLQDSGIVTLAPRGGVNVGELVAGSKAATDLGVVTTAGGGVSMIVRDNVDVNQSRVFTVGRGDLLIWAGQGNIDAGRGAKTVTGTPPPIYRIVDGQVIVDTSGSFSGSGIAVLDANSTLDLYAPKGEINAGDAGIRSLGNAFLGAARFVGADNLAISGAAVGAPPPPSSGGSTAGLASLGQSAALAATQVKPEDDEEERKRKRRQRLNLLLEFLGFGEAPARP